VQTRFACPFRHLPLSGGQIFARYGKASEICFINGMGGIVMWNLLHSSCERASRHSVWFIRAWVPAIWA